MKLNLGFQERHAFWGGDPPYPMVSVRLIGKSGLLVDTFALLDSGADCCLFHATWARRIGLDFLTGRREELGSAKRNAKIVVYYHRINLIVGTIKVRCDVGFSEDISEDVLDQLIGRSIVFNRIRFGLRQRALWVYAGSEC